MVAYVTVIVLLFLHSQIIYAWDNEQLEIFDLVEEINQNFYDILNISQNANSSTIKTAFRRLSLVLHPDKNSASNADEQFRNLVSAYDVLRDPSKREKYNDILVNGLPSWRSAVYYYRHVRKMGLAEASVILFIIITIGQYLTSWASYWEKRYTAEQIASSKVKDRDRKGNKRQMVEDVRNAMLEEIPRPSFKNTLPFQIPRWTWAAILATPTTIAFIVHGAARQVQEAMSKPEEPEPEVISNAEPKTVRRRKPAFSIPEGPNFETQYGVQEKSNDSAVPVQATPVVTGGLWTDDDLAELIQLVKRYPGGTEGRWEKIAAVLNRSMPEVTYMANKMKDNSYRLPGQSDQEEIVPEVVKKEKTKGGKNAATTAANQNESIWTQLQQQALESALAKYPKGPVDRWEKIAKCVPNKTKEECMLRYKHLVEMLRKQKETQQSTEE